MQPTNNWKKELQQRIGDKKMPREVIKLLISHGVYILDRPWAPLVSTKADKKKNNRKSVLSAAKVFWDSVLVWEYPPRKSEYNVITTTKKDLRESHLRYFAVTDMLLSLLYKEYVSLEAKDDGTWVEGDKVLGLNFHHGFYRNNKALCHSFFDALEDHLQETGSASYEWKLVKTGSTNSKLKVFVIKS